MKYRFGKTIVIALGGSVVYPEEIDVQFLKKFKAFIESFAKKGTKIVLVVGGGKICRVYTRAAAEVAPLTDDDKDWLGIHVTRTNAHLVRTILRKTANPVVIDEPHKIKRLTYPITVAGGWKPGWSTDYVAVFLAHKFGAKEVVIAGKPDAVYTKDPHKRKDGAAKKIPKMNWKEYRRLVPAKWVPGASAPVDPVAAKFADTHRLTAVVIRGRKFENMKRMLRGGEFEGTIIQ